MKTKVHKIVLLVVDTDNLDADAVRQVLENQRYPNHCISPSVMEIKTVEVDWSDEHPLNCARTHAAEFKRLFKS